ncbi:MAG: OmpH family outer membrane protein [Crocinitomicaceae bacterium]
MENKNTLAKVALVINVILIILVIILFTRTGQADTATSSNNTKISSDGDSSTISSRNIESTGKIAFFNMDSLNSKLKLYSEIEKEIQTAGKAAEKKMRNKQRDIDNWKAKWEKRGQLLSSEQEAYYKEAEKIQNEAMQFEQNVQIKLQQEQEGLMTTYALRISNFTEDFAIANGYDAVFSFQFGQSPWYYSNSLDVTNELAEVMNADFSSATEVLEEGE